MEQGGVARMNPALSTGPSIRLQRLEVRITYFRTALTAMRNACEAALFLRPAIRQSL